MDKESIYELQKIDCNCNNCGFMERDFNTWQYWYDKKKAAELEEFEKAKAKAIEDANLIQEPKDRAGMLRIANKMRFQFDKTKLISYGKCLKFDKAVSFIPDICQLDTQDCFVHRKDL